MKIIKIAYDSSYSDGQSFKLTLSSILLSKASEVKSFLKKTQEKTRSKELRLEFENVEMVLKALSDDSFDGYKNIDSVAIYRANSDVSSNQMANYLWTNILFIERHPLIESEWCVIGFAKTRLSKAYLGSIYSKDLNYKAYTNSLEISKSLSSTIKLETPLQKLISKNGK